MYVITCCIKNSCYYIVCLPFKYVTINYLKQEHAVNTFFKKDEAKSNQIINPLLWQYKNIPGTSLELIPETFLNVTSYYVILNKSSFRLARSDVKLCIFYFLFTSGRRFGNLFHLSPLTFFWLALFALLPSYFHYPSRLCNRIQIYPLTLSN